MKRPSYHDRPSREATSVHDWIEKSFRFFRQLLSLGIILAAVPVNAAITITGHTPRPNQTIIGRRPVLEVYLDTNGDPVQRDQILFMVDGMDVSSQVTIREQTIRYRPTMDLQPGIHRVEVTVTDETGSPLASVAWKFRNRDSSLLERTELQLHLSESLRRTVDSSDDAAPTFVSQGNVSWRLALGEHRALFHSQGSVYLIKSAPSGPSGPTGNAFDLANWLTRFTSGPTTFDGGDITVQLSEFLTGGSYARRGLRGQTHLFGTTLQAFYANPIQTLGFRNILGLNQPDQHVYGVALTGELLPDERLWIRVQLVEGTERSVSSFSFTSSEGMRTGKTYGILARTQWFHGDLSTEIEFAVSDLDDDILDPYPSTRDHAIRLQTRGRLGRLNITGQYRWIGPRFGSLANPGFPNDRAETALSVSLDGRIVSIGGQFQHAWDNLRHDPSRPQMLQNLANAFIQITLPRGPSLQFSYQRSRQSTRHAPAGFPGTDLTTQAWSGSLAYMRTHWNANLAVSYASQKTKTPGLSSTNTWNVQLSTGFQFSRAVSITPVVGWTQTKNTLTGTSDQTLLLTLTPQIRLIHDRILIDGQVSWSENRSSAFATVTREWNGTARVSLDWGTFPIARGQKRLTFQASYRRSPTLAGLSGRSTWDFGIFLEIGLPVNFLPKPF